MEKCYILYLQHQKVINESNNLGMNTIDYEIGHNNKRFITASAISYLLVQHVWVVVLHVLDALIMVAKSLDLTSPAQQEQTWQEQNIECF